MLKNKTKTKKQILRGTLLVTRRGWGLTLVSSDY